MESLLGTSVSVYIAVTVVIIGFAAFMTGQAIANTWRPTWQLFVYCALLGCAARFLIFALFDGELLLLSGYLIDVATLTAIAFVAYHSTRARKMALQYPWLYERVGVFGYRQKTNRE